jgi:hypothetical protein
MHHFLLAGAGRQAGAARKQPALPRRRLPQPARQGNGNRIALVHLIARSRALLSSLRHTSTSCLPNRLALAAALLSSHCACHYPLPRLAPAVPAARSTSDSPRCAPAACPRAAAARCITAIDKHISAPLAGRLPQQAAGATAGIGSPRRRPSSSRARAARRRSSRRRHRQRRWAPARAVSLAAAAAAHLPGASRPAARPKPLARPRRTPPSTTPAW